MIKTSAFSYDAPEESPGYLLWKTTVCWQRLIKRALEPYEVSHAQFVILAVVKWFDEHQEEATQINIANLSELDKMTVSKSLKKLSCLNHITRVECHRDSRAKIVCLTERGDQLIKQLVPIVERVDRDFFGNLSGPDQKALIKIFNQLSKSAVNPGT